MPILPSNAKFGDIIEWIDESGNNMDAVYQIGIYIVNLH